MQNKTRSAKLLWERYKLLGLLILVILLFLWATDFDPATSLRAFARILNKKFHEFEPYISRNVNDCFVILWTRRNPSQFQLIQTNTVQDIDATNFNR